MRSATVRPHLDLDLAAPQHVALVDRLSHFACAIMRAILAVDPTTPDPHVAVAEALAILGDGGTDVPQLAPGEYYGIALWAEAAILKARRAEREQQEGE